MPQSLTSLWTHLVFSTKERMPMLGHDEIRRRMQAYLVAVSNGLDCQVRTIGGMDDHIHMLLRLSKNIPLCKLVEAVKKKSSLVAKTLVELDPLMEKFYWQRGYGAFSVSESAIKPVVLYIENQEEHRRRWTFQQEMRTLFDRHRLSYDERYVWVSATRLQRSIPHGLRT